MEQLETGKTFIEKRTKYTDGYIGTAEFTFSDVVRLIKCAWKCLLSNKHIVLRAIDDNEKNYIIEFLIENDK